MKLLRNFRPGDWCVVVVICVISALCWIAFLPTPYDQLTCEIVQDQTVLHRIVLQENFTDTIIVGHGEESATIQIDGLCVYFSSSTCPDQLCVHAGKLTTAGQMAVCLPNQVIVRLVGTDTQVDAIVG